MADYKQILEELKKKNKKQGADFIEFQDGNTIIRVLPGHPNMDAFFVAVPYHRKGEGKDFVKVMCLNQEPGQDDCEICRELVALRDSDDKDDKKLYKDQMAKDSYFFAAIERKKDPKEEKPALVECGTMLLEGVLALLVDPDYGEDGILHAVTGRDVTVNKSGSGMKTKYTVTPRANISPIFAAKPKASAAFIGTSAEDTKLADVTPLARQFDDEPEKLIELWNGGWAALKGDGDDKPTPKKTTTKSTPTPQVKKTVKPPPDEEEAAETEEETVDITSFTKLKSRCAECGDPRYKAPSGPTCAANHGGKQLAEGERPAHPSKAYLAEFPDPEEEETEESEEEVEETEEEEADEAPAPKTVAKPGAKKPPVEPEGDDGLEDLDTILKQHSSKTKK